MVIYNDANNYKYYKTTKKSGCVSMTYNFKCDEEQMLIILDNQNELSGNYNDNN